MRKGVTLVELLVVIVIAGILLSFTISSYQSSRAKNKLNEAVGVIESAFNTARTNALTGAKDNAILPSTYGLRFKDGEGEITLFVENGEKYGEGPENYNYVFNNEVQADVVVQTYILPTDFSVSEIFFDSDEKDLLDLSFELPKANPHIMINGTTAASKVCLQLSKADSVVKRLIISQATGQISYVDTCEDV